MTGIKLLLQDIRYRKVHFGLSLLAVSVAATLFVAGPTLIDGYSRETRARMVELEATTTAAGDRDRQTLSIASVYAG